MNSAGPTRGKNVKRHLELLLLVIELEIIQQLNLNEIFSLGNGSVSSIIGQLICDIPCLVHVQNQQFKSFIEIKKVTVERGVQIH